MMQQSKEIIIYSSSVCINNTELIKLFIIRQIITVTFALTLTFFYEYYTNDAKYC